ncbi:hypothetical protein, variant 1 [Aphanomyces astaci]|uniref:Mitochondrial carrier protein n=1 Tax=Aphanomyces astaci TaxID=112090 RepID=W4HD96_APHAT|nr:hypothetical protein, variant 1 [Aphanomyces astaci]ETV89088.1 hypothetical protein, variant 1 [Aphanomyces astaci]|eukprot:XP_009821488.1 hypothetical protein, variant 1 [Aphanomyces astaci]
MEVVKTRMQLQGELAGKNDRLAYRSFRHALYMIGKTEGIRGLQSGLVAGMAYNVVMNGVRLGGFGKLQQAVGATNPSDPTYFLRNAMAGAMSGSIAAVFGSPFFLVKARLQGQQRNPIVRTPLRHNSTHHYSSMMDGFRQIVRTEGPYGLWRGTRSQMARLAVRYTVYTCVIISNMMTYQVGTAAQLSTYTSSKHAVQTWMQLPDGVWAHIGAAAVSGLVVTTCMHPFDVVATRLSNQPVVAGRGQLYSGVVDCLRKIWATEGLRGLCKGWTAHYFRVGPHTMFTFVLWEQLQRLAHEIAGL